MKTLNVLQSIKWHAIKYYLIGGLISGSFFPLIFILVVGPQKDLIKSVVILTINLIPLVIAGLISSFPMKDKLCFLLSMALSTIITSFIGIFLLFNFSIALNIIPNAFFGALSGIFLTMGPLCLKRLFFRCKIISRTRILIILVLLAMLSCDHAQNRTTDGFHDIVRDNDSIFSKHPGQPTKGLPVKINPKK